MDTHITVLGLDVHKHTIAAALLPAGAETVRDLGIVPNTPEALRKLVQRVSGHQPVTAVYEAGPGGYATQRQLDALGVACAVVAPSLTPVRPGDRVKTDRRDAAKLARLYRAGELTEVRVPTAKGEAARDLVRGREDVLSNVVRARHRLQLFLWRQGRIWRETRAWTFKHRRWLETLQMEFPASQVTFEMARRTLQEAEAQLAMMTQAVADLAVDPAYRELVAALRCLKGVDTLGAVTMAVEVQDFRRFPTAKAFMSYTGLVPGEHSSGLRVRRLRITKTGNAHVRRVLVESAWGYRGPRNRVGRELVARRREATPAVLASAQQAQDVLWRKFHHLVNSGKPSQVAAVAVARQLAGFAWSLARVATQEVNG